MQTLLNISDYGHIELRLREVLERRRLTRGALARAIGVRFEVINRWCGGSVEKLDLDVLARICCVLDCQISDLLVYLP